MVKYKKLFSNYYFLLSLFFFIWILFFDKNDLISQIKLRSMVSGLEEQKEFYSKKIIEVEKEREELLNNDKLIEKFAREKYLMKKETEDIYVIVENE